MPFLVCSSESQLEALYAATCFASDNDTRPHSFWRQIHATSLLCPSPTDGSRGSGSDRDLFRGCKTRTHAGEPGLRLPQSYAITPGHENFPRHWHILMKDKYPNLDRTITSESSKNTGLTLERGGVQLTVRNTPFIPLCLLSPGQGFVRIRLSNASGCCWYPALREKPRVSRIPGARAAP